MLKLHHVTFRVPESDVDSQNPSLRTIIDDVSFTFEPGRFYATES